MADVNLNVHTKGAKEAERQFRKLGTTVQSTIAAYGSLGIAMYAAFRFLGKSKDAFVEQEQAITKVKAVLRSTKEAAGLTYDELNRLAVGLAEVTTHSDQAYLAAESVLLTFTKIGHDVFPQALEAAADMSDTFGQDLQQSIIQLGTALNDPIRGVGRLRRIGISFTQQQSETIKKLMDENRLLDAQAVILDELAAEFGGVARAKTETFGGQLKELDEQVTEVQEGLGGTIAKLNEWTGVLSKLTDYFKEVAKDASNLSIVLYGLRKLLKDEEKPTEPIKPTVPYVPEFDVDEFTDKVKIAHDWVKELGLELANLNIARKPEEKPIDTMMADFNNELKEVRRIAPPAFAAIDKDASAIIVNIQELTSMLTDTFDYVFIEALVREKNFADAMVEGFKSMLDRMVAQLLSRSILFGILSLFNVGTGGFWNFVTGGLVKVASASGGGGNSNININMPNVSVINSRSIGQIKSALDNYNRLH